MSYSAHIKNTYAGLFRVCIVSIANGKLVLQGETIAKKKDAQAIKNKLVSQHGFADGEDLDVYHKWTRNAKRVPRG